MRNTFKLDFISSDFPWKITHAVGKVSLNKARYEAVYKEQSRAPGQLLNGTFSLTLSKTSSSLRHQRHTIYRYKCVTDFMNVDINPLKTEFLLNNI
jgi:hypothetical protein